MPGYFIPCRLFTTHALLVNSSQLLPGRTATVLFLLSFTIHTIILVSFRNIPPHCCCIDCTVLSILSPAPHNNTVYRTGGRLLHVCSHTLQSTQPWRGRKHKAIKGGYQVCETDDGSFERFTFFTILRKREQGLGL